jgi:ABC-type uncharacterized transport system permease subunit
MSGVELVQSAPGQSSMIILGAFLIGIFLGLLIFGLIVKCGSDVYIAGMGLLCACLIIPTFGLVYAAHIQNDEYQGNLDTLNRHYDISIIDKSDKNVYGKDPTNIDFFDSHNKLHHGTLIMKGNTATIYVGSGSEQNEYSAK